MFFDNDMQLFVIIMVSVLVINAVFLELAKFFRSKKPSNNQYQYGDNPQQQQPPRRRSTVLAIFFYLFVISVDIVFIVWLFTGGKLLLENFIDFSLFDELAWS